MSLADQSLQFFPVSARVSVLRARGLRIKGKDGTNDAYTALQAGRETFRTPVAEKRTEPEWGGDDAAFIFTLPAESARAEQDGVPLQVRVLHRVPLGADKLLGLTVINVHELRRNSARENPQWFKLLNKAGKADKERGEVLLDIQFLKSSMSVSMIDLSDKSHSRLGKFKDKLRGKKKDGLSDSASAILPSVSQVLTDSEGEMDGQTEGESTKKKNKLKSLFVPKSNMKRNSMSQSMSSLGTLPDKNSSISSSTSSGLNVESSEGKKKKKFTFLTRKRNGSTDSKASNHSDFTLGSTNQNPPSQIDICINGSHVYREETQSEEVQEMEEEEEEEEEEGEKEEEEERWRREEEEQRRKVGEEKERIRMEREKEEQRRRIEEEEKERIRIERVKEEQKRRMDEEEKERIRMEREKEEQRRRMDEEEKERIRMEREKEEQRRKIAEEKERVRMEREKEEEGRRMEDEEKERIRIEREIKEQRRRIEEEEKERLRIEGEEEGQKRRMDEKERIRMEIDKEEQRIRMEEEERERQRIEKEEQMRKLEEERKRKEEREAEELRRKIEEENDRKKAEEEEKMRIAVEERMKEERKRAEREQMMEEEKKQKEEKRIEMERRLAGEKKAREAEERRLAEEKEKQHKEEERIREEKEWKRAEIKKKEEEQERRNMEIEEKKKKEKQMREEQARLKKEEKIFEESVISQSTDFTRSARISNIKPSSLSVSVSETVSQPSMANTNPFLDDDLDVSISENVISLEETAAKKGYALLPPQLTGPDVSSKGVPKQHSHLKKVSKCPAPQPPGILKMTREVTVKESMDQAGLGQGAKKTPERHHESKVLSVSQDDTQFDTNHFTCDGPVAIKHNNRPAPKPGSGISVSEDKPRNGGKNLTEGKVHLEEKASASNSKGNPSNWKLLRTPNDITVEDVKSDLTDDLSQKEHLEDKLEPDSVKPKAPSCVNQDLCSEPLIYNTDRLPSIERSQKKSRAPLPPAKPKRTGDPSTPHQQPSLSNKTNLEQAQENHSNKKDQDNAWVSSVEIPATSTPSSSTVSSSTFTSLAEKLQVMKPCATESVETDSGSGSRTLPWAKVVPNDAGEVMEQVAPTSVIRQHAVKPLSAAENQPENHESRVTDNTQPKTKAAEAVMKGPYSQLTQTELISLALRQQEQISQREARIQELERYIDSLLVRVMEEKPSILMTMNTKNKSM